MTVIHAPFDWPLGLTIVGLGLPLLLLILTYIGSLRMSLPWALCLVSSITPVISPVSWYHYLILLILPASQIFDWLRVQRFPLIETSLALGIGLLLLNSSVGSSYWLPLIAALSLAMLCYWIALLRHQATEITGEI